MDLDMTLNDMDTSMVATLIKQGISTGNGKYLEDALKILDPVYDIFVFVDFRFCAGKTWITLGSCKESDLNTVKETLKKLMITEFEFVKESK